MSTKDVYFDKSKPIKIGVLMDVPERHHKYAFPVYDFICGRFIRSGRIHRGIELVKKIVFGPPAGLIHDVMRGYHELCDQGVLAVIGPNHSDNNIAITEEAKKRRVPVLSLGAAHTQVSRYVFNVGWGSIPDDSHLIANWLLQKGHLRVTMTYDTAAHCALYADWFRQAAARGGIKIAAENRYSDTNEGSVLEEMEQIVDEHRSLRPDAIVCFATGASGQNWGRVVAAARWDVPRIMNGGFFQANYEYTHEIWDGWVGTALWDDDNPTLAKLRGDFRAHRPELGDIAPECLALWRDGITALLEGISLAPILTPKGVVAGLERVRMIPAAMGGARTVLSFGPHDRIGHKGMDKMVLRRLVQGKLLMEGRYESNVLGQCRNVPGA